MRLVVQRVTRASVREGDKLLGEIGVGAVVLAGIGTDDDAATVDRMADKLVGLRYFRDADGRTNLAIADIGGSFLVVSQFTLYADTSRGRRPGFTRAALPEQAVPLIDRFVERLRIAGVPVETGRFGAEMSVELINDGPFTLLAGLGARPSAMTGQLERERRPALSIGAVVGGQHDRMAVKKALRIAARAVAAVSPEVGDPERDASVNVIFQISGHLFQTEHQGSRTGRFTKSKGLLVIEVGVPDDLVDEDAATLYFADSLVEAVDLAEGHLAKRAPYLSVAAAREASIAARDLMLTSGDQLLPPSDIVR